MRNPALGKSVKSVNPNDVEGAVLAIVALEITQPGIDEEDEYGDSVAEIMGEYCPLFRVPEESMTPGESKASDVMQTLILEKVSKMVENLLSSNDPLLRALAGQTRTAAE